MRWACLTRYLFSLFLLALSATALPDSAVADTADVLHIADFSQLDYRQTLPPDWQALHFANIDNHTDYVLHNDHGTTVIKATSRAAASGLIKRVDISLHDYPYIQWRWKIGNLIAGSDVAHKQGDDYPARLYITFAYDPQRLSFLQKLRYRAIRLLYGDVPLATINYIWARREDPGQIVSNAYTDAAKMIIVESGPAFVGKWRSEQRNVYQDYIAAFGTEPPPVNGIAIMTDTDNTQEQASAYYGDIQFSRKPFGGKHDAGP